MATIDLPRPDVLVVDDQPDIRELLRFAFEAEGLTVHVEGEARRALASVSELQPRCVVLDVMMPNLDGFGFIEAMRRKPTLRAIPVVFVTAKRQERDFVRGLELGAVDYVAKPFDPQQLAGRVREVISMSADERRACRDARLQQALILQQVDDAFARRR